MEYLIKGKCGCGESECTIDADPNEIDDIWFDCGKCDGYVEVFSKKPIRRIKLDIIKKRINK